MRYSPFPDFLGLVNVFYAPLNVGQVNRLSRFLLPEPTSPPQNVTFRLQSSNTVAFSWEPPAAMHRNGHITHYSVQFRKRSSDFSAEDRNTSHTRMVFSQLSEKTDYTMRVRACTAKGCGPWSQNLTASTPGDIPSAPTNVQAVATSDQSVEVWWDEMPYFGDILGYQVGVACRYWCGRHRRSRVVVFVSNRRP